MCSQRPPFVTHMPAVACGSLSQSCQWLLRQGRPYQVKCSFKLGNSLRLQIYRQQFCTLSANAFSVYFKMRILFLVYALYTQTNNFSNVCVYVSFNTAQFTTEDVSLPTLSANVTEFHH